MTAPACTRRLEFPSHAIAQRARRILATMGLDVAATGDAGEAGRTLSVGGNFDPVPLGNFVARVLKREGIRFWWLAHESCSPACASCNRRPSPWDPGATDAR